MAAVLTELLVGDDAAAWQAAGFAVDGDRTAIGSVGIRFAGADGPRGVLAWTVAGIDAVHDIDGVPTTVTDTVPGPGSVAHPNGVVALDHVVVASPDLERTVGALADLGIEPRRSRDVGGPEAPRRQVFFWLGEPILELVGPVDPAGSGPSKVWGLACTCADLDTSAASLGEHAGRVKEAVQPGRRISTLRTRELDISVPIALMSTHVSPAGADDA